MVRIRLARAGKRNNLIFKIVVIEKSSKNTGKNLAVLGTWKPTLNDLSLDKKELKVWVEKGAQVSDSVKKLMTL